MFSRFSLLSLAFILPLALILLQESAQAVDPVVWNFDTNVNQEVCSPQQTTVQTCWHVINGELFPDGNNFEVKPDPGDGTIKALFINPKALQGEEDPRIEGPKIALDATVYSVVHVRMKSKADRSSDSEKKQIGEIHFKTGDYSTPFDKQSFVPFQIINDGEWRTYTIYMGNHPSWTGTITQIRVDPPAAGGYDDGTQDDTVAFDYVQIDDIATTNGAELIKIKVNGQDITTNPLIEVGSGSLLDLNLQIKNTGSRDWTEKNGYYLRWVSGFEAFPNSSGFRQWFLKVPRDPSAIIPGRSRLTKDGTLIDGDAWNTILAGIKSPKKAQDYPIKFQVAQLLVHDGTPNGTEIRFGPEITLTVRVLNGKPGADAGPDMTAYLGDKTVQLDGTASSDPEDDPLTYQWTIKSKPEGSNAQLSNPSSAQPILPLDEAGVFTIQLVVSDGKLASNPDEIRIVVKVSVTGKTPVIIIPGIYGSSLFNASEINFDLEDRVLKEPDLFKFNDGLAPGYLDENAAVWIPESPGDSWKAGRLQLHVLIGTNDRLRLNPDGETPTLPTVRMISPTISSAYMPLIQLLKDIGYGPKYTPIFYPFDYLQFGRLVQATNAKDIFTFAYDWRLSIDIPAENLLKAINAILQITRAAKVDIIAHSQGALVTRYCINELKECAPAMRKIIFLSPVLHGSPKSYAALKLSCFDVMTSYTCDPEVVQTAKNIPTVFQLLPTTRWFDIYNYLFYDQHPPDVRPPNYFDTKEKTYLGKLAGIETDNDGVLPNDRLVFNSFVFHATMGPDIGCGPFGCKLEAEITIVSGAGLCTPNKFLFGQYKGKDFAAIGFTNGDATVPLAAEDDLSTGSNSKIRKFYINP